MAIDLGITAKKHKMIYTDAPVSGGVTGAAAGTLTFMVGPENEGEFNLIKPILECMGRNIFNCGKPGAGQITKACNNMALAIEMIGISEALALGKSLGMDEKVLTNIMKVSTSRCWSIDTYNPVPGVMENVPASRNYDNGFGCALMLKDLGLALEAARTAGVQTELGDKSREIYSRLTGSGLGKKDFGVIYDVLMKK